MTIDEYIKAPKFKKSLYRLFRNPLVLFGLGPLYYFMIRERFASKGVGRRQRRSVTITNLADAPNEILSYDTTGTSIE